jgi:hypothetical protein
MLLILLGRACRGLPYDRLLAPILALRVHAVRHTDCRRHFHDPELPYGVVHRSSSLCSSDRPFHHDHHARGHARALPMPGRRQLISGSKLCCAPNRIVYSFMAPTRKQMLFSAHWQSETAHSYQVVGNEHRSHHLQQRGKPIESLVGDFTRT